MDNRQKNSTYSYLRVAFCATMNNEVMNIVSLLPYFYLVGIRLSSREAGAVDVELSYLSKLREELLICI